RGLGVKNVCAQGAIADATVFDPYEAQLAELAARAPTWTGIGLVGKLLSVQGDDGALVARIKRAAAGVVAAGLVDGLVASARLFRSSRVLSSSTATSAEKTAAQEVVTQSQETIQNVADATHTAEGDHVSVRQTPDGQYTLDANTAPHGDVREFVNEASPTFPNRGEAEAQATVINDGLTNAKQAATGITEDQLAAHRQFADELFAAQSPDEIAARATDANFNLSYYSSQPEVM